MAAAAHLGVSYQMVRRAKTTGWMSEALRRALERYVTEGPGSAESSWWRWLETLQADVRRLDRFSAELRDRVDGLQGRIDALREESGQQSAKLQASVTSLGKRLEEVRELAVKPPAQDRSSAATARASDGPALAPARPPDTSAQPRLTGTSPLLTTPPTGPVWGPKRPITRPSPRPVWTFQMAHWEERHEAAMAEAEALAVRWTEAKAAEGQGRTRLDRVKERERILEMESKLIHDYHVSIPPGEWWDDATIGWEASSRWRELAKVRGERDWLECKRWLRRLLTLGLWWK